MTGSLSISVDVIQTLMSLSFLVLVIGGSGSGVRVDRLGDKIVCEGSGVEDAMTSLGSIKSLCFLLRRKRNIDAPIRAIKTIMEITIPAMGPGPMPFEVSWVSAEVIDWMVVIWGVDPSSKVH